MNVNHKRTKMLAGLLFIGLTAGTSSAGTLNRTVLPIPEPDPPTFSELDVRNTKAPPRFEVKAPAEAPNVVIVLIDDLGFGAPSTLGGPMKMPTMDKLAQGGVIYNNFHTTAICSATRTALKSGRNHHQNNTGAVMENSTGYPGNTGQIPDSVAPLATMLQLNGYSTAAFGKWHETAVWETSVSGPFARWPLSQGFDKFYGFIGGETDQWKPLIYDGVTAVNPPEMENYHFTTDMTNQAINWIAAQQSMTPDKPFFVYFSLGAVHAPHHVSPEWSDKYKGQFDKGWDKVREATYEKQKQMGLIPKNTKLAPKPRDIKDWDQLSADEKRLFTRQAEVFAGFVEMTDHEIGRLVDAIEALGEMDNTMIIYIAGDNGTSAEGGQNGMFNEMTYFNGVTETVEDMLKWYDEWGTVETSPHFAAGWAVSFNSPFTWTKQVASDFGGTRNGAVIHWPGGIESKGELRSQFTHVIDVAPTILEAAGLPEPKVVNGVPQTPIAGTSMVYTFDDAKATERHTTQYFEIMGNRAIYRDGWLARTIHRAAWETKNLPPLESDVWDLYNVHEDFSLSNNLAAESPEQLKEMQDLFMYEAQKYHVLPIDDRSIERMNSAIAGRPDLMAGRTSLTLYEGMTRMRENAFINVKNRSKTITADLEIPEGGAKGVIVAQGGNFGGWSLYLKDGKPGYTYNFLGLESYVVESDEVLPAGPVTLKLVFDYDGGGLGKGGQAKLMANGKLIAEGRIDKTEALMFSADEGADVGLDSQSPVAHGVGDGPVETRFTSKIRTVTVDVADVE